EAEIRTVRVSRWRFAFAKRRRLFRRQVLTCLAFVRNQFVDRTFFTLGTFTAKENGLAMDDPIAWTSDVAETHDQAGQKHFDQSKARQQCFCGEPGRGCPLTPAPY